jgi:Rod binding domain-containing protein
MLESISSVRTELQAPGATTPSGSGVVSPKRLANPGGTESLILSRDREGAVVNTGQHTKIHEAARQFEALLLGQILKSMKDSEGGWMGTGEDQTASSAMEYGQEMLAQQLSSNGGLGLANLIVQGLKPEQAG